MKAEIGSNFWEYRLVTEPVSHGLWWEDEKYHIEYFKSGRNATKALCRGLAPAQKCVLLPAYTCSTVIEPFVDEGWQISYYALHRDLTIDQESLARAYAAQKPSVVLFHSYFGLDTLRDAQDLIRQLQSDGAVIVEDTTQSLLSGHYLPFADYYVSSLRKFLAVPDGGILFSEKPLLAVSKKPCDPLLTQTALEAFHEKAAYFEDMTPENKERFRGRYQALQTMINDNAEVTDISPETLRMFNGMDSRFIRRQRQENYRMIAAGLAEVPYARPTLQTELGEADTPLYFPLYIEGRRKEIQSCLAQDQVYCPVIWPRSPLVTAEDAATEYMYANMLCIPVDQRYGAEEMQRVLSLLKKIS